MSKDIIIGIHSIIEALNNSKRENCNLYITEESLKELKHGRKVLKERINSIPIKVLKPHKLQEIGKQLIEDNGFKYFKIPSGMILEVDPLEWISLNHFYNLIDSKKEIKILALDQISDPQNAGAILRTCAFFNVDFMLISSKNTFGKSPAFFRNSSGAAEYIPIITTSNLSKSIRTLIDKNVQTIGFAEGECSSEISVVDKTCLVMGAEDKGISNAVLRVLQHKTTLKAAGPIETLNVSVASALAMNKFW